MKLTDLYNSIISQEPYNDLDIFFENHDSFEEIPLISRYSRADLLSELLGKSNTLDFLIGFSVFLLNTINTLARARNIKKDELFIAITFTDFGDACENQCIIPNIFIYPNQNEANDLKMHLKQNHPDKKSIELTTIQEHFSTCNFKDSFIFYESRFFDQACNEDIVRIYAIPKQFHER
ncbi:Imm15 family immunity protein [Pseudomonas sp. A-B-19]|uniref:Imm15 family immunity protein n=1 Tax=Pseudomonas sp. A-B-19 TaxID=2832405 RepID=UPI001CC02DD5|nr:Imm15 family immunity protein [Pseudomonas sp. A-B-19]